MASHLAVATIISWFFLLCKGDIVLQSFKQCGNNLQPVEERVLDVDELDVYSHSGRYDYAPNMNCIITIIGKKYHQWQISLTKLNIDKNKDNCKTSKPPCCNDFLKIFNSYRVDNARMFPSIPWQGLCGTDLPRQSTYTSSQNYITIQFNANPVSDYMTGFALHLRQFPRRSGGTELSQYGYIGGWNDGTLNELQIDWTEQEQIPGDYKPGHDSDFEYDRNGISCYECNGCKRDYFRSSDIGVSVRDGCYVCTTEWLRGHGQAARTCHSRTSFREKLRTLTDPSGDDVQDFRSCKPFLRGVQGSTYINLCVCDTNKCNKGDSLKSDWLASTVFAIVVSLISYHNIGI